MLLCDTEQIGSEWTQERLMMMPAANISASSATPATTAAGSSCSSSSAKLKGSMLQQQHQHDPRQHGAVAAAGTAAPKCPRCDSSNTKFCYYNNYSLSQPRHFCKACKRYWTRGGTLRNVPVGGGCRKNKRAKKPSHHQQQPAAAATSTGSATVAADPPQQQPSQSSATIDLSSFMYSADMNLAAYSSTARTAAYDALELGGLIPTSQLLATELISNNLADLQQQPAASFLNDDYFTSFGSQAASLLVSSLKQQPTMKAEDYQSSLLLPYDASANLGFLKDVKVEGDNNLNSNDNGITEWQASYPFEANGASDASNLYWTSAIGGAGGWPEAANPSIAHLI